MGFTKFDVTSKYFVKAHRIPDGFETMWLWNFKKIIVNSIISNDMKLQAAKTEIYHVISKLHWKV